MKYRSLRKKIMERLKAELPDYLTYHNIYHVLDVIDASQKIGKSEKIVGEDLMLLKTAALLHDTGFMYGAAGHELKSCEIAQEYLPKYGYTQEQIDKIKGMIMATKIPQTPNNHLEQILADADLDYLGRNDFFTIGNGLFEELKSTGVLQTDLQWNQLQERFLGNHSYFTATSIKKRNKRKQQHLEIIKSKLN